MKWLKSMFTLFAIVSAMAVGGSAFAYHRHWQQPYYAPQADVRLEFNIGEPSYTPAGGYYYYEPAPRYYRPAPRVYYYYGRAAGYDYYYSDSAFDASYYNRRFPQSAD